MRNMMAHQYGSVKAKILWDTVAADIPRLKLFCAELLERFGVPAPPALFEDEKE
jgi:uncharacterized protein with HEPN domain